MRRSSVLVLAALLGVVAGCSDDSPTGTGTDEPAFALQETYTLYRRDAEPMRYVTSDRKLLTHFHDALTDAEIDALLREFDLRLADRSYRLPYGFTLVEADDAFTKATELWRHRAGRIDYVGPVFDHACGTAPTWSAPTNRILVAGDVTQPDVQSMLNAANARLIRESTGPALSVYELPWGDPQRAYELCSALWLHPPIDVMASPNRIMRLCPR